MRVSNTLIHHHQFLQPSEHPVVDGLDSHEVVYAVTKPEYVPLRTIRSKEGVVLSRWNLTRQQYEAIGNGADIYLEVQTFNQPLQPVRLAIGKDVDPEYVLEQYGLTK